MYRVVSSHKQYDKTFTYRKYRRLDKAGGKSRHIYDPYTDFGMIYIPETGRLQFDEKGNVVQGVSFGIINESFFTNNSILPSTSDKIEDADGVVYRIMAVEDYTRLPHSKIYYVHLRRDELSVT